MNRVNRTVTKGQDRIIDYIIKPLMVWGTFTASIFLSRRLDKRPVTYRTNLLSQSAREVAEKHHDKGITWWFMQTYLYCLSRFLEFDPAYYNRFHESIEVFAKHLNDDGFIKLEKKK